MKVTHKSILSCLVAGCLYSASSVVLAQPESENSAPSPVTENGVTYMSGGIGDNEVSMMKQASKDYDVMLTFATKEKGAYVADVKVDIEDAKGNQVVSTVSEGPIFLADLPAGSYRVKAEAEGKTVAQNIRVSKQHKASHSMLWPQKTVQSPAPAVEQQSEASMPAATEQAE